MSIEAEFKIKLTLTPQQMAEVFASMDETQQAEFFSAVFAISQTWDRSGSSMQWWAAGKKLTPEGLEIVESLLAGAKSS